jgi:hypothetical protein
MTGVEDTITVFNPIKRLDHLSKDITSFCEGELLSKADARTAIRWEIIPGSFPAVRAFRVKLVGIRASYVFTSLHCMDTIINFFSFSDECWTHAIGPTTTWETGLLGGLSNINLDGWQRPQRFVYGILEV